MVLKSITKKKTNETVKQEFLNLLQENDDVEEQALNGTANNVNNSQEAILIIRHYEDIIRTQNKEAIGCIGKQEQLIRKFKDSEHFFGNVHQGRSTYFEILLYRFLKK